MARRSKPERQQDLVLIADMYVKNNSVRYIAEHINSIRNYKVSFQTVANDIQEILREWQEKKENMISSHVAIELEKSLIRERKLWEAWEKSESTQKKTQVKKKGKSKETPEEFEMNRSEEDGLGYYKFMELMQKEADFRCKLLGSFAPKEIENTIKTENGAVIILPANGRDISNERN
jgi:hypothetical protein